MVLFSLIIKVMSLLVKYKNLLDLILTLSLAMPIFCLNSISDRLLFSHSASNPGLIDLFLRIFAPSAGMLFSLISLWLPSSPFLCPYLSEIFAVTTLLVILSKVAMLRHFLPFFSFLLFSLTFNDIKILCFFNLSYLFLSSST